MKIPIPCMSGANCKAVFLEHGAPSTIHVTTCSLLPPTVHPIIIPFHWRAHEAVKKAEQSRGGGTEGKKKKEEMMRGGTGSSGSGSCRANPEKSLEELTHQDIMQLTREDCRRYLKEKGMRRPSWNKSQAIQQVLSLKNLFHSTPENAEEPPPPPLLPPPPPPLLLSQPQLPLAHLPVLATHPATQTLTPATAQSVAQLTIFYSGNVNVYNDVPAEKAQAIMLLAGAPNHLPNFQDTPAQLHNRNGKETATPVTRKASLQRFLEKKKDRGRCKGGAPASKKPPVLMGMFMHPSYWSEAGKKKENAKSTGGSPTRSPQTPSSDEQRRSITQNFSEEASLTSLS